MSNLENLLYSAYEHGKRDQMFIEINRIKNSSEGSNKKLEDIYQQAYEIVMKT